MRHAEDPGPDEVVVLLGLTDDANRAVGDVISKQLPVLVAELAEVSCGVVRALRHVLNYYSDRRTLHRYYGLLGRIQ